MINMDFFDGPELDRNNSWDNREASEMAGIMAFAWEGKRLPQTVTRPDPRRNGAFKVIKTLEGHFRRTALQKQRVVFLSNHEQLDC